jgi:hypothetical protein
MPTLNDKTDEFFYEKLLNHEVKPRVEAWQKLESKLQKQQKPVFILYKRIAIAASITLIGFIGSIAYFNGIEPESTAQNIQNSEKLTKEITSERGNNFSKLEKVIATPTKKIEITKSKSIYKNFKTESLLVVSNQSNSTKNEAIFTNPIIENNLQNKDDNSDLAINSIPESKIQIADIEPIKSKEEDLTILFTVANFNDETEMVNADNEITTADKKDKYINRLFKQLKNAKNGDRVDWDQIGFKPAKILARAESKLKTTQYDMSETYNSVKNKTIF